MIRDHGEDGVVKGGGAVVHRHGGSQQIPTTGFCTTTFQIPKKEAFQFGGHNYSGWVPYLRLHHTGTCHDWDPSRCRSP